ncbi:hypothetical protein ACQ5SO_18940 [Rhodovulum sp. DZ06]|uniref:hypothetical protein n=1 Tax=Rhodovulum sp. DZ06 TaxID=3425126 RepID=UPI003D33AD5D
MPAKHAFAAVLAGGLAGAPAAADTLIANVPIAFHDGGAGPVPGPYGFATQTAPIRRLPDLRYAMDGDPNSGVSLPRGSYIVLGFGDGYVIDGPGNDLFISEPGAGQEDAEVYVSPDFGRSFTYLGRAYGARLTELDLADIGYTQRVTAVKIVGLDNGGDAPGFDVAFVRGLEGSAVLAPAFECCH